MKIALRLLSLLLIAASLISCDRAVYYNVPPLFMAGGVIFAVGLWAWLRTTVQPTGNAE